MNVIVMSEATALPGSPRAPRDAISNEIVALEGSSVSAVPLSRSPRLLRLSEQDAAMSRLYGREELHRTIAGTLWQFRWLHLAGPILAVELRLRIGGAEVSVGLEDLGPFGSAADVTRPDLPAALSAAYLSAVGAPLWQELESITRRAVEVVQVGSRGALEITPECLGFQIGRGPHGPRTRGFVRVEDSGLREVLTQVSQREMPAMKLRHDTRIRWTAVAGITRLPVAEVRALQEYDVVVIDDATYTADALECWLGAGPMRRFAGRVSLRTGRLHMIDFTTKGNALMTSPDASDSPGQESGFDEIPVSLRFEVAQWQASLGEMAKLAAGTVIDLGRRVDEQSVTVWVEQRCIGKGQLVAIGERLGVRLLSVFAGSSPPATVSNN
jgi:type III secretion protein Q